jgi:hypothetical protein
MSVARICLDFQSLKLKTEDEICLICHDAFQTESSLFFFKKVRVLGHEKHLFHPECLRQWLEIDASCPTCRKSFSIESLKKVFGILEESKDILRRKYALIIGGVSAISSLAGHLSFSAIPPLGLVSILGVLVSFRDRDFVKSTAIACASLGLGAVGAAAGLEAEGIVISGCLGASIADELLKVKALHYFFEE